MVLLVVADKALKVRTHGVHKFGDSGDVPIGIANLNVPEVGRQRRHRYVNIDAVAMPGEETATDEGMSQIVKARQLVATLAVKPQKTEVAAERRGKNFGTCDFGTLNWPSSAV